MPRAKSFIIHDIIEKDGEKFFRVYQNDCGSTPRFWYKTKYLIKIEKIIPEKK